MVNYMKIVNILIINAYTKPNFVFLVVWDYEYSVTRGVTLSSLFLKYSLLFFITHLKCYQNKCF